jgi:diacylglycerol kinase
MKKFLRSFKYAFSGITQLLKTEHNFKLLIFIEVFVVITGLIFSITETEWLIVLTVSALVISLEAMNSALEKLCNLYSKEENTQIKVIKDIAAGAVLITAIFALIIGVIIFTKYFKNW